MMNYYFPGCILHLNFRGPGTAIIRLLRYFAVKRLRKPKRENKNIIMSRLEQQSGYFRAMDIEPQNDTN